MRKKTSFWQFIAPLVIEPIPFPIVPQGVYTALGLAITKPEGYLTYNCFTKDANLF